MSMGMVEGMNGAGREVIGPGRACASSREPHRMQKCAPWNISEPHFGHSKESELMAKTVPPPRTSRASESEDPRPKDNARSTRALSLALQSGSLQELISEFFLHRPDGVNGNESALQRCNSFIATRALTVIMRGCGRAIFSKCLVDSRANVFWCARTRGRRAIVVNFTRATRSDARLSW